MLALFTQTLYITLILVFILYYLTSYFGATNYDYWKKKGVPYVKPLPFLGNFKDLILQKTPICDWLVNLCKQHKGQPFFGIWLFKNPALVVVDPELMKHILIKGFNIFSNRGSHYAPRVEPFSEALFFANNPNWRQMRANLSKYMSQSQVRRSFDLINKIVGEFASYLRTQAGGEEPVNMNKLSRLNTTEIMVSLFFGLEAKCFTDQTSPIVNLVEKMFRKEIVAMFRLFCFFFAPIVVDALKLRLFGQGFWDDCKAVLTFSINERIKSGEQRGDFIDVLIELKNIKNDSGEQLFDDNMIIAQPSSFLSAGVATSSEALSFAMHEFCLDQNLQQKVRNEIRTTLDKYGGCTYEAIQDMRLLNAVISETLRKYPGLPFLDRVCNQDYTIPGSDVVIEEGTRIIMPVFSIHYNPEIYPNPERFDPNRFLRENKGLLENNSYLPFGKGPRQCIGKNYAETILKTSIVHILSEFEVEKCDETRDPIKYEIKSVVMESSNGTPMYLRRLNNPCRI